MNIITMPDEVNGIDVTVAAVSLPDLDTARDWFERVRPHADPSGPLRLHLADADNDTLETIPIGLDTAEEMLETELTLETLHHLSLLQQAGQMVTVFDLEG